MKFKREYELGYGFMTTVSARDFVVHCRPSSTQFYQGKPYIKEARVLELQKAGITTVLCGKYGGRIKVNVDGTIYGGHHRHELARRALESGAIDPSFKFQIEIIEDANRAEATQIRIMDNHGSNKTNKRCHIMFEGEFGTKICAPLYDAITSIAESSVLPPSKIESLVLELGGLLNNNPRLFQDLIEGRDPNINAAEIHESRKYNEVNKVDFVAYNKATLDLRNYIRFLSTRLEPGIKLLHHLRSGNGSDIWKLATGDMHNRTPLSVILVVIAESLNGKVCLTSKKESGYITPRRVQIAVRDHASKFRECIKSFNRSTKQSSALLADLFKNQVD